MPTEFDTRGLKREISLYEKRSLMGVQDGRALIMPAVADTEVEELISMGFEPTKIVGVEQDDLKFYNLRNHYWDQIMLANEEVGYYISRASRGAYSYVHLDYCGYMTREIVTSLSGWQHILAHSARVRISSFRGRRRSAQYDFEEQMFRDLVLSWCEIGASADHEDMFRWLEYDTSLRSLSDDTPIWLIMMIVLQATFGISDVRTFTDTLRARGSFIPMVEGRHRVAGIKRFGYTEPGTPNHMFTVWLDLEPLEISNNTRLDEQWAMNYIASILSRLTFATPLYHPSLSEEKT